MRKMVLGIAALAITVFGSIPVAANTTSGRTDLSLYVANDPVYTVTVPETVQLSATENTQVPITASDVKDIPEGQKISVTLDHGNGTFGRLYLEGTNEETGKEYLMTLDVKGTDGEFKSGALEKQIKGMELASFTKDGTMNYELRPVALDYPGSTNDNLTIQKGVHYSGYVTYGIGLKDIAK
nr:hypothetical protein [uncultured Anaerostipes sp.]